MVLDPQGSVVEGQLGDLLMEFSRQGPTSNFARVDDLPRQLVKGGGGVKGALEVSRRGGGGVAVVDEGGAQGVRDVSVLAVTPDAQEQFDVVEGPATPLQVMSVGSRGVFGGGEQQGAEGSS